LYSFIDSAKFKVVSPGGGFVSRSWAEGAEASCGRGLPEIPDSARALLAVNGLPEFASERATEDVLGRLLQLDKTNRTGTKMPRPTIHMLSCVLAGRNRMKGH